MTKSSRAGHSADMGAQPWAEVIPVGRPAHRRTSSARLSEAPCAQSPVKELPKPSEQNALSKAGDLFAKNRDVGDEAATNAPKPTLNDIYDEYFDFVWRSARRLGVADDTLDDAVQDVFLTVHRRLDDFRGDSSIRTWLFGIVLRTVRGYRRRCRRKPTCPLPQGTLADPSQRGPMEDAARTEAAALLYRFLDGLDDDKREVFVQAELEQMTAQEIAQAMGANINTVYSRLRAARRAFEETVARHRARDSWRCE